jgi:hypothetical protein
LLDIGNWLRRVCDRLWVVVTGIVVGRRVVPVPGPRIGESDPHTDEGCALVVMAMVMVAKALMVVAMVVAVEVAMAVADMPAVHLAAADMPAVNLAAADMPTAEFDTAAADMTAAFARKRGVADNYCEREKQCYGRRTHGFRLHPPGRQRVTSCYTGPLFGCRVALITALSQYWPLGVVSGFRSTRPVHRTKNPCFAPGRSS